MTGSGLTIGVDIGGTKVLAGVVNPEGTIIAQARRDTPADDVGKTLDFIVEVIEELAGLYEVDAVGIGAAGWIDVTRSTVLFAPNLAWRHEPLRDRVAERVSICRWWWRTTATRPPGPSSATGRRGRPKSRWCWSRSAPASAVAS